MFPIELKKLPNWVGYDSYETKVPKNPRTGGNAKPNDPSTWATYNEAKEAVQKNGWGGIGFMLTPPYIGIDLDDHVINGKLDAFAQSVINKCRSYTEYSPSKTGVHIIMRGILTEAIKRNEIGFEAYQTARYFTVTEKPIRILPVRTLDFNISDLLPNKEPTKQVISNGTNGKSKDWLSEALNSLKEGNRNDTFTRIAGRLRNDGHSPDTIYALLSAKATEAGTTESELRGICASIGRYEPRLNQNNSQAHNIHEFLKDKEEVEWICEPLISKGSITFVAGLPKSLKTWILMDFAICAASGEKLWLKRFPVKKSKVLFLDQERPKGETQRRFNALLNSANVDASILQDMYIDCGSKRKIDLQSSYDSFRKELEDLRPDIVIIDSFATFHTKEESNRMEIQQVLEKIKQLRDEFGCAFIFVHHETKQVLQGRRDGHEVSYADMSGSIAIPAAAEHIFNVVKKDDCSMVYHTANNLGDIIPPFVVKVTDLKPDKSEISVEAY